RTAFRDYGAWRPVGGVVGGGQHSRRSVEFARRAAHHRQPSGQAACHRKPGDRFPLRGERDRGRRLMVSRRRFRGLLPAGYARCLANREFRRMQPGFLISFLGDGMSLLGVAWLALKLAAPDSRPAVVGLAIAPYSLPAAVGSFTLGRWLSSRSARTLILLDSLLRGVVFTLIPVLHWLRLLDATVFIA